MLDGLILVQCFVKDIAVCLESQQRLDAIICLNAANCQNLLTQTLTLTKGLV